MKVDAHAVKWDLRLKDAIVDTFLCFSQLQYEAYKVRKALSFFVPPGVMGFLCTYVFWAHLCKLHYVFVGIHPAKPIQNT